MANSTTSGQPSRMLIQSLVARASLHITTPKPGLLDISNLSRSWCAFSQPTLAGISSSLFICLPLASTSRCKPPRPLHVLETLAPTSAPLWKRHLPSRNRLVVVRPYLPLWRGQLQGGLLKTWAEAHDVKAAYVQIPRDTLFATWSAIA